MKINNQEINIDNYINEPIFLKNVGNNILLNDKEIEVLKRYEINPDKYLNTKSLIFDIEEILDNEENEELEQVLIDISERDYYQNTNK